MEENAEYFFDIINNIAKQNELIVANEKISDLNNTLDDLKSFLDEDVINYDPKISLNGGKEGLEIIKSVIFCAKKLCKYNGKLILEIDPIQKKRVINILKKNGFNNCKVFKDYSQKERFIISTKTN